MEFYYERIKALREDRDLTQAQIAKILNVVKAITANRNAMKSRFK